MAMSNGPRLVYCIRNSPLLKNRLFAILACLASSLFLSFSPVCDNVPDLNLKVYSFVKSSLGKKIGRGECWDLAAQALDKAGASWDGQFGFGDKIDPLKDCV